MRSVIIGAGPAGISAASELAGRKPWEEITVIARDGFPYSRCMLHRYLSGERREEQLVFTEKDFFQKNGITFLGNRNVRSVRTAEREIVTDEGVIPYDKLLIAAGSAYSIPPVPNFRNAANVYGFRDLKDAKALKKACGPGKKVLIIGSGLIGMDVAYALAEQKADVTVVELASRIMPLQTDEVCAKRYQELFEKAGVAFYLGVGASDSVMDEEDNIREVTLSDGTVLSCDVIVVAAGVRPDTSFLNGSDIFINRGIQVDEYMRTSCEDVYAAGDITGLSGIWPNAVEQGRVAAVNMAGGNEQYTDRFCVKNTCSFFGLPMLSVGSAGADGDNYTILTQITPTKYKKLILRDERVVGALFQGDIAGTGIWQYLIKNQIDISGVEKSLFNISIADFHCFDEDVRKNRAESVMRLI
ncbi:MAG: NAD(P)/FAD-dependent oxidoreductase [Enterocloster sp.]